MTEQDYNSKILGTPTGNLLVRDDNAPSFITFNTGGTEEIAKFTKEGFYYKGEFVDDAGEVHRLLKDVLNGICYKKLCRELVDELEDWIAYGDEEVIVNAHALVDRARAALNA